MLHYYALKFFNPVLVSPYVEGDALNIYIVLDEIPSVEVRNPATQGLRFEPMLDQRDLMQSALDPQEVEDIRTDLRWETNGVVVVEMYKWNSFNPLYQWVTPYKVSIQFLFLDYMCLPAILNVQRQIMWYSLLVVDFMPNNASYWQNAK